MVADGKSAVLPVREANAALLARLTALFEDAAFADLAPGITPPRVYRGFPKDEPPFYVAVDEIADEIAAGGGASVGHASIEFTTHVWLFARHRSKETVSDTLLAYADTVLAAVMADHTLDMAVDNAQPSVASAGTAADSSNRYMAAASVDIRCTVGSACPARVKEIVNETNRNL